MILTSSITQYLLSEYPIRCADLNTLEMKMGRHAVQENCFVVFYANVMGLFNLKKPFWKSQLFPVIKHFQREECNKFRLHLHCVWFFHEKWREGEKLPASKETKALHFVCMYVCSDINRVIVFVFIPRRRRLDVSSYREWLPFISLLFLSMSKEDFLSLSLCLSPHSYKGTQTYGTDRYNMIS